LKLKKDYYESKEAKTHYLLSLRKDEKGTKEGLADYMKRYEEQTLNDEASDIAQAIGDHNGKNINEITITAKQTTNMLISIIGNGNEIHISLNPPKEVREVEGQIELNYKDLKKLVPEEPKAKEIEQPKKDVQ